MRGGVPEVGGGEEKGGGGGRFKLNHTITNNQCEDFFEMND